MKVIDEFHKLKFLSELPNLVEIDTDEYFQKVYEGTICIKDRTINEVMSLKFGDGISRIFLRRKPYSPTVMYTHYCPEDGYWYHESWFIEGIMITLEKELFEI